MDTYEITAWDDAGVRVVQVNGEFDMAACERFREERAFGESELVVVDLRRATFIDSHGLAELIALQRETARTTRSCARRGTPTGSSS